MKKMTINRPNSAAGPSTRLGPQRRIGQFGTGNKAATALLLRYIMIENPGVAAKEAYTLMGASINRLAGDRIGQFGTGNKGAIALLLREGIEPVVFLGTRRLHFFTQPISMASCSGQPAQFDQVYVRDSLSGNVEPLSYTAQMGEINWKDPWMAFRELVANPIDAATELGQPIRSIKIQLVTEQEVQGKDGTTRFFFQATDALRDCLDHLKEYFLHFADVTPNQKLIKKPCPSKCRVYRRRVFIRELQKHSLFDYNFTEELDLTDDRNAADGQAEKAVARTLGQHGEEVFRQIVQSFGRRDNITEHDVNWDDLTGRRDNIIEHDVNWDDLTDGLGLTERDSIKRAIRRSWQSTYADRAIPVDNVVERLQEIANARGWELVKVPANWRTILLNAGVPDLQRIFSKPEIAGYEELAPSPLTQKVFDSAWSVVTELHPTQKPKPKVVEYKHTTNSLVTDSGYYDPHKQIIYIRGGLPMSELTAAAVEEIAHYITGAEDFTRSFQSFLVKLIAQLV